MFDTVHHPARSQIELGVAALAKGISVVIQVDVAAYVVFTSCEERGLPYEVDVVCVSDPLTMALVPMSKADQDKLLRWSKPVIRDFIKLWKQRFPVPRTPEA